MIPTNQKKVFTTEKTLTINLKDCPPQNVELCLSVYPCCVFAIINGTGAMGSILRGEVVAEAEVDQEYGEDDFNSDIQKELIYDQKVLLGSTQIELYDLMMRKLLQYIFEDFKFPTQIQGEKVKVLLNISLKLNSPTFDQAAYFQQIMSALKGLLQQVL